MTVKSKTAEKPRRIELPHGTVPCDYCTGKCCKYIALPIDTPRNRKDYDEMRWFLAHEDVSIFVEDGSWYIMMHRRCQHLMEDNRCGIYHTRPQVCRDYSIDTCEYEDEYTYEKIFETDDQMWEYAKAVLGDDWSYSPLDLTVMSSHS